MPQVIPNLSPTEVAAQIVALINSSPIRIDPRARKEGGAP